DNVQIRCTMTRFFEAPSGRRQRQRKGVVILGTPASFAHPGQLFQIEHGRGVHGVDQFGRGHFFFRQMYAETFQATTHCFVPLSKWWLQCVVAERVSISRYGRKPAAASAETPDRKSAPPE